MILQLVQELGVHQWGRIARRLGARTPRQCRERWRHYLHPVIVTSPWTAEENALLVEQYKVHGPKWAHLSTLFPGRTEVNLKNQWSKIKKNLEVGDAIVAGPIPTTTGKNCSPPVNTIVHRPESKLPRSSFFEMVLNMPAPVPGEN
jgi:hypothetical protein